MAVAALQDKGARQDQSLSDGREQPRALFTWELPEHVGCRHVAAKNQVAAIRPDGTRLAFCSRCNQLLKVR
jgi:hypothetical protein